MTSLNFYDCQSSVFSRRHTENSLSTRRFPEQPRMLPHTKAWQAVSTLTEPQEHLVNPLVPILQRETETGGGMAFQFFLLKAPAKAQGSEGGCFHRKEAGVKLAGRALSILTRGGIQGSLVGSCLWRLSTGNWKKSV